MNIFQIGQVKVFQGNAPEDLYPRVSSDTSNTGDETEDTIDIALPGKKEASTYDRTGSLVGTKKPSEDPPLTLNKDNADKDRTNINGKELDSKEQQEIARLRQRDRAVRAHEMAHAAAGGGLVRGAPHYEYERGPDGNLYAVGGEVSIDTSEEKTPERTAQKMQRVQAAAMAPADPSGQDRAVAAAAARKGQEARAEMAQEALSETRDQAGQTLSATDSQMETRARKGYSQASPGKAGGLMHIVV